MQEELINLKAILRNNGIYTGYSFRGKVSHVYNGGVRIIQLKDFENDYTAIGNDCFLINGDKIKSKYYLEQDDILFTSKGTNNYALVFQKKDDLPTIASSALFVIKIDKKIVDPYYIAWYINQNPVQNYFRTNESGTYITSINKSTVEEIPIALPPMKIQRKIAKIANLHTKERFLTAEISTLKNRLITNQLLNLL